MKIMEIIELLEKLAPIIVGLYNGIHKAIEDAHDLDENDKQELIKRIQNAKNKVKNWDELN